MSWLECLYFYLRSGQPELFTDLDFHFLEIGIAGDYLLVKFHLFSSVVLFSLYLVIIFKLLLYLISSIVSYVTLIYLYSSFMNYYLFHFRCIIITLCLWSVIIIYCIFWDLPNFYLQRGILSNSIPAWVSTYTLIMDANGWKYLVVTIW